MVRVIIFGIKDYEKEYFEKLKSKDVELVYFGERLTSKTKSLIEHNSIVVSFVNDCIDKEVLSYMKKMNVLGVCTRSAGFNHIDIEFAKKCGVKVFRVPAYSPTSVAEHCLSLIMCLNRKIHKAHDRVKEHNFSLDGLVGRNLSELTFGVIGTGKIGTRFIELLSGFNCKIFAYDINKNNYLESNCEYVELNQVLRDSDVICLHLPLNNKTKHIIGKKEFETMKSDVMLVNTSRGGLINTKEMINALKKKSLAAVALDVYEEEEDYFFQDCSNDIIKDDLLARLLTFPNVLLTAHQGFLTHNSLVEIAKTTYENINSILSRIEIKSGNRVC